MSFSIALVIWLVSYFVGSIPFGFLVGKMRGTDIRVGGSGNIGATNTGRILGPKFGALVFLLDFLKGAIPVGFAAGFVSGLGNHAEGIWSRGALEVGAGVAAMLGHVYPIFLHFKGGKGVATGAGIMFLLDPVSAFAALLTWIGVLSATHMMSLASILASVVMATVHFQRTGTFDLTDLRSLFILLAPILVIFKHRDNIRRLRAGTENQLKERSFMEPAARSFHVLALGMWCGMGVFFSFVAAPILFRDFEALGEQSAEVRPAWFPRTNSYARQESPINGPKEQGTRAAGFAVSGIFPWYYLLQGFCGFVALGTALGWSKQGGWHRRRVYVIGLALLLVMIGWPLEHKVTELRPARNQTTDAFLQATPTDVEQVRPAMIEARRAFATWHVASLLTNMATVLLVIGATALAGNLPGRNDAKPV